MCLATVTLAMAQQAKPKTDGPSIKFEKTTHDFGTFSESKFYTEVCVHIHKRGQKSAHHQPGHRQLWLHNTHIHKGSHPSG